MQTPTDLFQLISNLVDENLYKFFYEKEHKLENIRLVIKSFNRPYYDIMEKKMKPIKCISFVSSIGCFLYSLNYFSSGNLGNTIFYAILCVDFLNISYNCYTPKYILNIAEEITSSITSIGENILNYMRGKSPMDKYNEIQLHLLMKNTIVSKIIGSVIGSTRSKNC